MFLIIDTHPEINTGSNKTVGSEKDNYKKNKDNNFIYTSIDLAIQVITE